MNTSDTSNVTDKPVYLKAILDLGFHIFPLKPNAKIPIEKEYFKRNTQLQAGVADYAKQYPGCNLGGFLDRQFILDIDVKHCDGFANLARLEAKYGKLPQTRTHSTPSGGKHFIYRQPAGYDIPKRDPISDDYPGVDLQANGCYIVLPYSTIDGKAYQVVDDSPIVDAPIWLCDFALECKKQTTSSSNNSQLTIEPGAKIPQGEQDNWLASRAGGYHRKSDTTEQIIEKLKIDALRLDQNPARPYTYKDFERIARSVARYPIQTASSDRSDNNTSEVEYSGNLTGTGNAEFFTRMYHSLLRYDHRRTRWLKYSGHYYIEDSDGYVNRLAIKAVRRRYQDTTDISDLQAREKAAKWCIGSEQMTKIDAMLSIAKSLKPIADSGCDFDSNQWVLAVANGVIDLKTGALRDGKPEDRITQHSNIVYDPNAPIPTRWLQFLDQIFSGDKTLIYWIWRALGYSISGSTKEQIIFMLFGAGANGKSKLLDTLRYILGDFAYNAPFSTFELDSRSAIPNDMAALDRKRFITSIETNDGARLNESRIKTLSGEDDITARFLHQEFFTFKPMGKLWLGINHKPRVNDDSYGFWRRVRLIPFLRTFKGKDADNNLSDKLIAEVQGILNWLIDGCLEYQEVGLSDIPAAISGCTNDYQADSDPIAQFLLDINLFKDSEEVLSSEAYKKYVAWAEGQGLTIKERLSNNSFGRRMSTKFAKKHKENGKVYLPNTQKLTDISKLNDGLDHQNELIPNTNPRIEKYTLKASNPSVEAKNPSAGYADINDHPGVCTVCNSTEFFDKSGVWTCHKCYEKGGK